MGLLDKLKNFLGKRSSEVKEKEEKTTKVVSSGPSLSIEEVDLEKELLRQARTAKDVKTKRKVLEDVVDEKKKFIEVVNLLREMAGLGPVEVKTSEQPPSPPPRSKIEIAVSAVSTEDVVHKETQEKPTASKNTEQKTPKRPLSKAEIEKIVKVVLKKLETRLLQAVEEDLRKKGVRSFKALAMERRHMRERLRERIKEITEKITEDLIRGVDVRADDYVESLVRSIYPKEQENTYPEVEKPEKAERKVSKEEEEDLLSLLEEKSEKKQEEKEKPEDLDDDLLKLLES